jgi:hypothetical protein
MAPTPVFLLLLLRAWLLPTAHPFYVSVTEVEYERRTGSLGVSCKFFTDDLEEALKGAGDGKVDLFRGDAAQNRKRVEAYLQAHFQLSTAGQPLKLAFLGMEHGIDATWCYLEASGVQAATELRLRSDCFYEIRKEQVHIFHITVDGNRRSRRIVNPEREFSVRF